MSNDGQDICDTLRNLAPQVDATDQAATDAVDRVERFLSDKCRLQLPASAIVFQDDADGSELLLAYDQHDGAFRIVVVRRLPRRNASGEIEFDRFGKPFIERTEVTPWKNCDRTTRFTSLIVMPDLLKNLATTVRQAIEVGQRASASVERLLASLPQ